MAKQREEPTDLLLEAANQIKSLANESVKESYIKALADSLRFDPDYQPGTASDTSSTETDSAEEIGGESVEGEGDSALAEASEDLEASESSEVSNGDAETPDDAGDGSDRAEGEPASASANGEETPPNLPNPREIAERYGVSVDDLDSFHIVIRRKPIPDFVRTYCGRKVKKSEVTRVLKVEKYEEFFKKPISRCGKGTKQNATVYSYAEVLQRLGFTDQIKPPQEILDLFKEFGANFPEM